MSRERDKLIAILNELEEDYRLGNISHEKYVSLRERYIYKINTIDASNRVRSMQNRGEYNSVPKYKSKRDNNPHPMNNSPKRPNPNMKDNPHKRSNSNVNGYYDENGNFHPFRYENKLKNNLNSSNPKNNLHPSSKSTKESKSKTSVAIIAALVLVLLLAFGAGMVMGVFNNGFTGGIAQLMGDGAAINDTAFPIAEKNVTYTTNYTSDYTSNYTTQDYDDYNYNQNYSSDSKYESEPEIDYNRSY